MGFFSKISEGLKKTRDSITGQMELLINSFTKIDEEMIDELEETLIMSDVGAVTASRICEELRKRIKRTGETDPSKLKGLIRDIVAEMLTGDSALKLTTKPSVILVIGVNGAGKTTTIGKMAAKFKEDGKSVILGAADTFRAAAIDQLAVWAERSGTELIRQAEGSDPAAVIFDTLKAGQARDKDIIICDTAGRLHNKKNLMDELGKISRVITRELPDADVETLLVLDATTGQNALNQARQFKETAGLTGIILTKLDGTAKGGVVIGIREELQIPIKYIGVGEKIEDLREFDPYEFASAIFDVETEGAQ
ncbi:MAG: signal recognition particle-docking protein FtsY [Oscillospiraceae bacterium]|jgi:fused signal recognition particle receptor|nr:signal recognition particle-docking protein FtsY [Oscillospiraceae bacterium]